MKKDEGQKINTIITENDQFPLQKKNTVQKNLRQCFTKQEL